MGVSLFCAHVGTLAHEAVPEGHPWALNLRQASVLVGAVGVAPGLC